ncbi:putative damage-inducible protein DinB [Saonia flava]|uniref:Putative damage-inducible protein DinB n=1 Tax=Saonia flava TaxID=523696 RepID=A0A846R5L3_9FLAO|nr:DinB family protein [Saonia flava]NJB72069.1 putative damage-inducible protein DinB [Saonia flava]
MQNIEHSFNRRNFIKKSSLLTLGAFSTGNIYASPDVLPLNYGQENDINIVGPKEGFTPQIGTLVSMMNWMRMVILSPVKDMSVFDLDFLVDENANSIGAMLMHLAATERFYQIHTFENKNWGDWPSDDAKKWTTASRLGDEARKKIKGNTYEFYLNELSQVREHTIKEFAKRDDEWLLSVDQDWPWGPTNNYCKWFHVCEHESNHNGQFKFIKSRITT